MKITDPGRRARRALVGVLARAFRDNPMNVRIHGSDPVRRVRANAAGLRSLVLDFPDRVETRVITYDSVVVGGFVAAPPGEHPLPRPSLRRQIECLWLQGIAAMTAWSRVTAGLPDHRPAGDHWSLAVLGVEPAWQGRGLGGALLGALADRVALNPGPVCLECDRPESVRFYRAHGFEVRAEGRVHGVPCWCLGRGCEGRTRA
ncbi:MAG: GNAT family N-acetyltransferase [Myxococcota bacterium]